MHGSRCSHSVGLVLAQLVLVSAALFPALAWAGEPSETRSPEFELLLESELMLPMPEMRWASDIRELDPRGSFAVAAGRRGVIKVDVTGSQLRQQSLISGEGDAGGFWLSSYLGVSAGSIVTASPVFALAWKSRKSPGLEQVAMGAVTDLDLHDQRLLVLGERRAENGEMAPDGAIAWLGELGSSPETWKVLQLSTDGPGAWNMDSCAILELGAVRFLADGSFMVIPGVQPGVFLYSVAGRLQRTWESNDLGFYTGCDLSEEQVYVFSAEPNARVAWLNQREVLNDILPTEPGPALLVRRHSAGVTQWRLELLLQDGSSQSISIPWKSTSAWTFLRGTVNENRIVLLVEEKIGRPGFDQWGLAPPQTKPRLLIFSLKEKS